MNLLPILTGQIEARACDWTVKGKGGTRDLREEGGGERMEEEELKARMEQNHRDGDANKGEVTRGLIAGEYISI